MMGSDHRYVGVNFLSIPIESVYITIQTTFKKRWIFFCISLRPMFLSGRVPGGFTCGSTSPANLGGKIPVPLEANQI